MLSRNDLLEWVYNPFFTKLIQGQITSIVTSKKSDSLILLRHREQATSLHSELTIFYFGDSVVNLNQW